jgi:hypothetical protein
MNFKGIIYNFNILEGYIEGIKVVNAHWIKFGLIDYVRRIIKSSILHDY